MWGRQGLPLAVALLKRRATARRQGAGRRPIRSSVGSAGRHTGAQRFVGKFSSFDGGGLVHVADTPVARLVFREHLLHRVFDGRRMDARLNHNAGNNGSNRMNKKLMIALGALFAVVVHGEAEAAYADSYDGIIPGYYMPYSGRLAGFFQADLSGTPILIMSTDPTIYVPPIAGTPVNLYTYADVQSGAAGLKWTATVYSQIGYAISQWVNSSLFDVGEALPPTHCITPAGDWFCAANALWANAVIWGITTPGSADLTADPIGPDQGAELQNLLADITSGSHDHFDWSGTMEVMQVSGGDTFVIPLGGATLQTSTVPIPSALSLFSSGLLGLISVARRRNH